MDTVLVFTNCVEGWPDDRVDRVLRIFPRFGDIVLDARLFGRTREAPAERQELIGRFEALGFTVTPIAGSPADNFYVHLQRAGAA